MSKKVIEMPESFDLSLEYNVRVSDLNGHHLGQDSLIAMAIDSQRRFFAAMGLDFDIFGYTTVYSESAYTGESSMGDELRLDIAVSDIAGKSFKTIVRYFNQTRDREVARVLNTHLFFDFEAQKAVVAPDYFLDKLDTFRKSR